MLWWETQGKWELEKHHNDQSRKKGRGLGSEIMGLGGG